MGGERLAGLLARRLAEAEVGFETPVSVSELHRRLLPYPLCRAECGFATKAEYDLALLSLMSDPAFVLAEEEDLAVAIREELESPEPGLAPLQRFAAAEIRFGPRVREAGNGAGGREIEEAGPAAGAAAEVLELEPAAVAEADDASPGGVCCRACGAPLPERDELTYCPFCGADQCRWPCDSCGATLERGWRFCVRCGEPAHA